VRRYLSPGEMRRIRLMRRATTMALFLAFGLVFLSLYLVLSVPYDDTATEKIVQDK